MPVFAYRARTGTGRAEHGIVDAESLRGPAAARGRRVPDRARPGEDAGRAAASTPLSSRRRPGSSRRLLAGAGRRGARGRAADTALRRSAMRSRVCARASAKARRRRRPRDPPRRVPAAPARARAAGEAERRLAKRWRSRARGGRGRATRAPAGPSSSCRRRRRRSAGFLLVWVSRREPALRRDRDAATARDPRPRRGGGGAAGDLVALGDRPRARRRRRPSLVRDAGRPTRPRRTRAPCADRRAPRFGARDRARRAHARDRALARRPARAGARPRRRDRGKRAIADAIARVRDAVVRGEALAPALRAHGSLRREPLPPGGDRRADRHRPARLSGTPPKRRRPRSSACSRPRSASSSRCWSSSGRRRLLLVLAILAHPHAEPDRSTDDGRRSAATRCSRSWWCAFIIGLLVTIVAPRIVGRTDDARQTKAAADPRASPRP
jgi:hypothetical protein